MDAEVRADVEQRWPGDALALALFEASDGRADLLHNLCCLPSVEGMIEYTVTSDHHFLGRPIGDIGFNAFLGQPPAYVQERNLGWFLTLSTEQQVEVIRRLRRQSVKLPDVFGQEGAGRISLTRAHLNALLN
jgi:hypothetical protein